MSSDASRDPELFDVVASTYALVGASDGHLDDVEVQRLRSWGAEQGFDEASIEVLVERCLAFAQALAGPEAARHRSRLFDRIRALKEGGGRASLVLAAARVAVVADERILEPEEEVLREIGEALGLDPDLV
jgi:tellurite resistance protein